MNICPQCAYAFMEDPAVLSSKQLRCENCGWEGDSRETIFIDDSQLDIKKHQEQLETLYKRLATEVSPAIGMILIETKMVTSPDGIDEKVDWERTQFLAKVLQGATRGCIGGIARAIAEEVSPNERN